jgi:pyruvate carboxylase
MKCGVPVLPGTDGPTSVQEARQFLQSLGADGAIMIKAIAGGGGRGMRQVLASAELDAAYERCRSEAKQAFGNADVYVEKLFPRARHIEVQVVGDGSGRVTHLWERECSIQRNRQKLVEIAPAPGLPGALREHLIDAALRMARDVKLRSLATFEFLVESQAKGSAGFAFIEANPRLQVEHTVTEEVTGIDLVRAQLDIAGGRTLEELELVDSQFFSPRGMAMQVRVNAETMAPDGTVIHRAACWTHSIRRRVRGCASIPARTPACASIRVSTRCWQRSSCMWQATPCLRSPRRRAAHCPSSALQAFPATGSFF